MLGFRLERVLVGAVALFDGISRMLARRRFLRLLLRPLFSRLLFGMIVLGAIV